MRKYGLFGSLAALLAACASATMTLTPSLQAGRVRTYRMVSDVTSVIGIPGAGATDRTLLHATVAIRLSGPTATVTLTPTRFERDGKRADPPAPQTATLTFDETGTITGIKGQTPQAELPLGGSADDLGALLGITIRRGRIAVADRWRTALDPSGERRSRVAALRYVAGRRCAIVESVATRPVERTRETNGTTLRLSGTETSIVETAFAFDEGLVASLDSTAEGTFTVAGAPQQGSVTIRSKTSLLLTDVRPDTASPTPSASPSPGRSARPPRTPSPTPTR